MRAWDATVSKDGGVTDVIHDRVVKARGGIRKIKKDVELHHHQWTNQSKVI